MTLLEDHLYATVVDFLQTELVDEHLLTAFLKNSSFVCVCVCGSKLYFSFLFAHSFLGQSNTVVVSPSVSSAAALAL